MGLGNPGPAYAETRHNVGFRVVEALAQRHRIALSESRYGGCFGAVRIAGRSTGLLLPQRYMNLSGRCVAEALGDQPGLEVATDLVVVYDDLDLEIGRLRMRASGGAGGHRGMASVIEALGRQDFPRLRFGIGRPAATADVIAYVLERFSADEEREVEQQLDRAVDALDVLLAEGVGPAMDAFNRTPESSPSV